MIGRVLPPALILLAVYYALFGGEYSVFAVSHIRGELEEGRIVLAELRAENEGLRARVDMLEHDREALERLARERFGMIRDGEVLYRFADSLEDDPEPPGGP